MSPATFEPASVLHACMHAGVVDGVFRGNVLAGRPGDSHWGGGENRNSGNITGQTAQKTPRKQLPRWNLTAKWVNKEHIDPTLTPDSDCLITERRKVTSSWREARQKNMESIVNKSRNSTLDAVKKNNNRSLRSWEEGTAGTKAKDSPGRKVSGRETLTTSRKVAPSNVT